MVVVGDGPKRLRLRDPGCFLIRSLMVRYELVSVFGLVVIFWMNACIKWLSGMLFNYDRAVLLLLYVKDRPDAFFWPWTPSASIMPESNCSVKWFASFPACCLMAQGAPLQYRWWYFWIIMSKCLASLCLTMSTLIHGLSQVDTNPLRAIAEREVIAWII